MRRLLLAAFATLLVQFSESDPGFAPMPGFDTGQPPTGSARSAPSGVGETQMWDEGWLGEEAWWSDDWLWFGVENGENHDDD